MHKKNNMKNIIYILLGYIVFATLGLLTYV